MRHFTRGKETEPPLSVDRPRRMYQSQVIHRQVKVPYTDYFRHWDCRIRAVELQNVAMFSKKAQDDLLYHQWLRIHLKNRFKQHKQIIVTNLKYLRYCYLPARITCRRF